MCINELTRSDHPWLLIPKTKNSKSGKEYQSKHNVTTDKCNCILFEVTLYITSLSSM